MATLWGDIDRGRMCTWRGELVRVDFARATLPGPGGLGRDGWFPTGTCPADRFPLDTCGSSPVSARIKDTDRFTILYTCTSDLTASLQNSGCHVQLMIGPSAIMDVVTKNRWINCTL